MERRFFRASKLSELTTLGRTFLIVSVAIFRHIASMMLAQNVIADTAVQTSPAGQEAFSAGNKRGLEQ